VAPEPNALATLPADSFLERAFLRWVLAPAATPALAARVGPQHHVEVGSSTYRVDYATLGQELRIVVELDGYEHHGHREAFTYDRLRQNDLHAAGWLVVRFSYDSIRLETARCVHQLQAILARDALLRGYLVANPHIERPDMDPDPLCALGPAVPSPAGVRTGYFDNARARLNLAPLRGCQRDALAALANYFRAGGRRAACVMAVGAGKTALGVAASLAFARQRVLVVTPGDVIRGTFGRAFDHEAVGNTLYGLPGGPLTPGTRPPNLRTLDRDAGPVRSVTAVELRAADVIVTNFHSLGTGDDPDDLLAKLAPDDIDLLVIDEAHIAAAESYQRCLRHFATARALLMSACFQRLDGRPIEADVVYRYRLIDSVADGHAKNLRVHRFAPDAAQTTYEIAWPDGTHEEVVGRDALLAVIDDERRLARITARSDASIRQVVRAAADALAAQTTRLAPVRPRVLFAALGERHAEQIARIATEHGIPSASLHHSMSEALIKSTRARFEQESGDLQGLVQLRMLGQGYDFPPITVVAPLRPYGSFSEFYQFIGRGVRVVQHPALAGRLAPQDQFLDIICHGELDLDRHLETIYRENDMDPTPGPSPLEPTRGDGADARLAVGQDDESAGAPAARVIFEHGLVEQRVVHDAARVEARKREREREALAQRYSAYVQSTERPVSFEQFVAIMGAFRE
jgi:superfamily II DNA or RNA helicase